MSFYGIQTCQDIAPPVLACPHALRFVPPTAPVIVVINDTNQQSQGVVMTDLIGS